MHAIFAAVTLAVTAPAGDAQHVHTPVADSGHYSAGAPTLASAMARMASGTAWLPDRSPSTAVHLTAGEWRVMVDGAATLQYVRTTGLRAQWQVGSANWVMAMADRGLGDGVLQLRGMLSAEPATLTDMGYPQLLQVALPYRGGSLTDRQHPHELVSELAIRVAHPFGRAIGVEVYVAAAGEPAIGPVAYRHRPSAASDAAAPLGHHAQDVTHTTFGVVTLGAFGRRAKLEGSIFNGRHADETRTNLELAGARLDSWAARLTANPTASVSVSAGFARFGPGATEGHAAGHGSARRWTASVAHVGSSSTGRTVATALVYGVNLRDRGAPSLPAALIEANADLGPLTIFGRAEHVRRNAGELALTGSAPPELDVRALSLGIARRIGQGSGLELSGAVRGTMNLLPGELALFYGNTRPMAFSTYLSIRPADAR